MSQLNKFSFSIDTNIVENNIEIDLSSNEDIQRSVIRKEYGPVHSYVETFSQQNEGRGDSYSLPYQFKWFHYLNNSFQVGIFNSVQSLMMTDVRPVEHNFFKVIYESFPLLQLLHLFNDKPQDQKQQSRTHYAEQFLFDRYCHFTLFAESYDRL
ncbi:unnamed protein product [Rotaria magnacalcarata]